MKMDMVEYTDELLFSEGDEVVKASWCSLRNDSGNICINTAYSPVLSKQEVEGLIKWLVKSQDSVAQETEPKLRMNGIYILHGRRVLIIKSKINTTKCNNCGNEAKILVTELDKHDNGCYKSWFWCGECNSYEESTTQKNSSTLHL
jgi:hypothetical protein